ncbi:ABC transporter permease [Paractinoplanes lichenicola]|uniref:ABC transporter permease n=1 Tax=Paractinoplanes lichenicola TaxID=2802976 RepID=A0ABS1VEU6_9ACTN|nr:ABC transporter permease [Actinoplanes lichenicola]MBL7253145.1 ABC transporter permease [Actinoplanes lichenicola]
MTDVRREVDGGREETAKTQREVGVAETRRGVATGAAVRRWLAPGAAVVLLIAGWQAFTTLSGTDAWLLPSPADALAAGREDRAALLTNTAATAKLALAGLGAAVVIGLALAVVLHLVPLLGSALYPLLVVSQNIPTVALAPLLVVWLGFGMLPKVVVIVLVCFFPLTVATLDGLRRSDPVIADYLLMSGASRGQLFRKLELPAALPPMFSGLKIAATYSVVGAIIAEWMGADQGLGKYMIVAKSAFRADKIFVAIAVTVVLSLTVLGVVLLLERVMVKGRGRA